MEKIRILVRQERRKPNDVVIVFLDDRANPGLISCWASLFEPDKDHRTKPQAYSCEEWNLTHLHETTKPLRDPRVYTPYLKYLQNKYYSVPVEFVIRERITYADRQRIWACK